MSSGRSRDEDGGGGMSGGVYVNCLREPVMRGGGGVLVAGGIGGGSWRRKWSVTEGVTGSLKLAMRRGKVVQVDADGKSLKSVVHDDCDCDCDCDRESQIGLAL